METIGVISGLIGLVFLFICGGVAVFIGGFIGVAGVRFGTKVFGPIEILVREDVPKTFD